MLCFEKHDFSRNREDVRNILPKLLFCVLSRITLLMTLFFFSANDRSIMFCAPQLFFAVSGCVVLAVLGVMKMKMRSVGWRLTWLHRPLALCTLCAVACSFTFLSSSRHRRGVTTDQTGTIFSGHAQDSLAPSRPCLI